MFVNLVELYHRNVSNKWPNIGIGENITGIGEEITQKVSTEINLTQRSMILISGYFISVYRLDMVSCKRYAVLLRRTFDADTTVLVRRHTFTT